MIQRIAAALLALALAAPAHAADISTYSETDANNNGPTAFPEGMAPSAVNDAARAVMGATKRSWNRQNPTTSTTGSSPHYVLTPANTSYPTAYQQGETFCFKANFTSAGGDDLNVNSLGAKPLYKMTASGAVAVIANDIQSGQQVCASYDSALNGASGGFQMNAPSFQINPLNVKGASGNVVAGYIEGYGTAGSLSTGAMWLQFRDNSANRSTILDFQPRNSAGSLIDQGFVLAPGLQWSDAGHEQFDVDFAGYVNGVLTEVMHLNGGCINGSNTSANNASSVGCPVTLQGELGADYANLRLGGVSPFYDVSTSHGMVGIIGGAAPGTGYVGEVLPSSVDCGSPVSLSSGTAKTVVDLLLSAGTWDLTGVAAFTGGSTTTVSDLQASISATTNTMDTTIGRRIVMVRTSDTPFATDRIEAAIPTVRVTVSSPAHYYIVENTLFGTSTLSGCGFLRATRVF